MHRVTEAHLQPCEAGRGLNLRLIQGGCCLLTTVLTSASVPVPTLYCPIPVPWPQDSLNTQYHRKQPSCGLLFVPPLLQIRCIVFNFWRYQICNPISLERFVSTMSSILQKHSRSNYPVIAHIDPTFPLPLQYW